MLLQRSPARLGVTLLALLLVLGEVLAMVHLSATTHSICAEHGELVHGHGSDGGGEERSGDEDSPNPTDPPEQDDHEDDHCRICASLGQGWTAPTPQVIAAALPETAPRQQAAAPARPRASNVYAVAPKNSPPRA